MLRIVPKHFEEKKNPPFFRGVFLIFIKAQKVNTKADFENTNRDSKLEK